MPIHSSRAATLLTAGAFALAVAVAPAVGILYAAPPALAEGEGGVPEPQPVPVPAPQADQPGNSAGCQSGESLDPSTGNCVPTMTPLETTQGDQPQPDQAPPPQTGAETSTVVTGDPANLVPNLNGYPCTGYWESAACYAVSQTEGPPVEPKSTISSSP
ncbi:hypothetical protein [Mycobacterium sp. M26]|uniref:hypothetical protein n=1 Tax=Mycobacterium sp. M26 TaxID=1762962 RepID=UPI00073F607A|nr:hypothetical protein [Mycobacterium sp. M26]